MSLEFYKLLHFLGLALILMSLGGNIVHALGGGTRESHPARRMVMMGHGIGLLIMLVSGFGMLAKLGIGMPPGWALAKLAIWLLLGGLISVTLRMSNLGRPLWAGIPALVVLAGWLATYKPF